MLPIHQVPAKGDSSLIRAREIIWAEARAIAAIQLTSSFNAAIAAMETCRGKIVASGMAKAGLVARRFVATLCSTGTPAVYLHPAESAHGDLGVLAPEDRLIAFSTSGKTAEVLDLVRHARPLTNEPAIGITSHPDSKLRDVCGITVDMGKVTESCTLGLIPTASIAVMSAISDALALVLMERKKITLEDYRVWHPGGDLGGRASQNDGSAR